MIFTATKTVRIFGNISDLPDHLHKTDLQENHPFYLWTPLGIFDALGAPLFDYQNPDLDDLPSLLTVSADDIEKYFVPCTVTTRYNGHATFEWRQTLQNINNLGGVLKIKNKITSDDVTYSDKIYLRALIGAYDQMIAENFGGSKNGS